MPAKTNKKRGARDAARAGDEEPKPLKDVRVDQIGFCKELVRQHADELKTRLKLRMDDEEARRVRGEVFEGVLACGTTRTLDPRKLWRMVKRGQITEAQFLGAVKVNLDAAAELLSGKQLERMCGHAKGSPSLTVTRIEGVELRLVDVLRGLTAAIDPK